MLLLGYSINIAQHSTCLQLLSSAVEEVCVAFCLILRFSVQCKQNGNSPMTCNVCIYICGVFCILRLREASLKGRLPSDLSSLSLDKVSVLHVCEL